MDAGLRLRSSNTQTSFNLAAQLFVNPHKTYRISYQHLTLIIMQLGWITLANIVFLAFFNRGPCPNKPAVVDKLKG